MCCTVWIAFLTILDQPGLNLGFISLTQVKFWPKLGFSQKKLHWCTNVYIFNLVTDKKIVVRMA